MRSFNVWLALISVQASDCLIQVKDILNAEFLPSTLLLEEARVDDAPNDPLFNVSFDGDVREAYYAMQFHRSKMNEFLCRNYVAEEILTELKDNDIARLGIPAKRPQSHRVQNSLLKDEGSSSYKDWLSRSMMLDDMYQHYDHDSAADEPEMSVEIESGEVTGYAIHPGNYWKGSGGGPPSYENTDPHDEPHGPPIDSPGNSPHSGGGYSHMSHGGNKRGDEHYYYHHEEDHHSSKSLALKDLFDLALTALAFLAFGVFVMNLILNSMVGAQGTTIIMTSTTTTTTVVGGLKDSGRVRRSTIDDQILNEIAYRVMISYDRIVELSRVHQEAEEEAARSQQEKRRNKTAAAKAEHCLQYSLCQNNKFSRSLKGSNGLWIPMWSFGLSWLVGRLGLSQLESLQASVYGLGSVNCKKMYPSCRSQK